MYCSKCGKELQYGALVCHGCGCMTDSGERLASESNGTDESATLNTLGYLIIDILAPILAVVGIYIMWKINKMQGLIFVILSATSGLQIISEWKKAGGKMNIFFKDFIREFRGSSGSALMLTIISVLCLIAAIASVAFVIYLL